MSCFHCAAPLVGTKRWRATVAGLEQPMCCAGCAAVTEAIVAAGLDNYYRHRSAPAPSAAGIPSELAGLAIYDEPELQQRFARSAEVDGRACREATLALDGMRCGACVWLLERALAAVPGVVSAHVNLATERAVVRWDPERTRLSRLLERIHEVGYVATPFDARLREAAIVRTSRALLRRLFVAGLGMMQVMMYAYPEYTTTRGEIEPGLAALLRWASLALTTPVFLYSAQPFLVGAVRDLRALRPGMDMPVAIGIVAAFGASTWATVSGQGEVYFDSVTMFVFFLLGARYLEWVARRRAGRALDAIAAAAPERVARLLPGEEPAGACETVPAARLAVGDRIEVASGERVAVDAVIIAGRSSFDLSLLTGESVPVVRGLGDTVPGGALNAGAPLTLRVLRAASESTLSTIERLVERSAQDKPRLAQIADRVAAWFVGALLTLALAVLIAWSVVDPERALPIAIAVLVVSCPCALSLATPAALAAATGALLRRHVLVTRGHTIEALARCTDVVFDKTGTLTQGTPTVSAVREAPGVGRAEALRWASRLEEGSTHPFGRAIVRAANEEPGGVAAGDEAIHDSPTMHDRIATPGAGVGATLVMPDGSARHLRLGSALWCGLPATTARPGPTEYPQETADSAVFLVEVPQQDDSEREGVAGGSLAAAAKPRLLAAIALRDRLRPEAGQLVAMLAQAGVRIHLASGDRAEAVAPVAAALGIKDWRASASPADKLAWVQALQARGASVLMVGDGINDAPVMAGADVSIAVGGATALARVAADAIVLTASTDGVIDLLTTARRCVRVVRQNLAWAVAYNAIAIPAAALGWVPPWLAALGMAGSSLLVVGNAARLWSWKRSTC